MATVGSMNVTGQGGIAAHTSDTSNSSSHSSLSLSSSSSVSSAATLQPETAGHGQAQDLQGIGEQFQAEASSSANKFQELAEYSISEATVSYPECLESDLGPTTPAQLRLSSLEGWMTVTDRATVDFDKLCSSLESIESIVNPIATPEASLARSRSISSKTWDAVESTLQALPLIGAEAYETDDSIDVQSSVKPTSPEPLELIALVISPVPAMDPLYSGLVILHESGGTVSEITSTLSPTVTDDEQTKNHGPMRGGPGLDVIFSPEKPKAA